MENQSVNQDGGEKIVSDEENSASESSEEEDSDSSFDEDDVGDDYVPAKRAKPRYRSNRGRKPLSKDAGSNCSSPNNLGARRTRLSQKLEERIPLHLNSELQAAYRILEHLMSDVNQSYNWPFMDEVNVNLRENRNYSVVIEKPLCLNQVKTKLLAKEYANISEVIGDVRLVLENCYSFYGASYSHSKKGFRLEMMLEHKLQQLPRDLKDKTAIVVTSPKLVEGVSLEELESKAEQRSPAEASMVMACVKHAKEIQEEEEKKLLQKEREFSNDPTYLEVLEWETKLIGEHHTALKAMWELPQIGHFLFLAQNVLNIPEVSQFELERAFFMPQASSLFSIIMTALLSNPKQRSKLSEKPPMPYRIWHERLRVKIQTWYKLYYTKERNPLKVLNIIGIEPQFFRLMGDVSPLEKRKFHELELFKRVWMVKSLCDFCLHSHKSVQESLFLCDPLDHREVVLGEDVKGNQYLHFPQFCGQDLRVYRQASYPEPSAPDLSCPPKVKEFSVVKTANELQSNKESENLSPVRVNSKDTEQQQTNVQCSLSSIKCSDTAADYDRDNSGTTACSGSCAQNDKNNSNQMNVTSTDVNNCLNNGVGRSSSFSNCIGEKDGIISASSQNANGCIDSAPTNISDVSKDDHQNSEGSNKPKLIMKFKKEVSDCSANVEDASESCDGKTVGKRRKSKNDVFTICRPDEMSTKTTPSKFDPCNENSNDLRIENNCEDANQKCLPTPHEVMSEKDDSNHVSDDGNVKPKKEPKIEEESKKRAEKPKRTPTKVSDCHSLESTWIGSRRKGKRGRKSRATQLVISYDAVPPKPDVEQFELVVQNLDSLRELAEAFEEKEQPTPRTRKKKAPQQKSSACEKALHKRLCNLLKELETWELTLLQTTKNTRFKMMKEWEEYQAKAVQKEEEVCNDIWGSEEEDDDGICDSSSSSSSEDEYEDLEDATSFRMQHLRQCTRKKRVRGEDEQSSSIGVSSENSNSSEAFHLSVSSRGRIRKIRRLDTYEEQPARKVSPLPKRQFIVLNGIQPDQRNMLEAHRIQNSKQDAKMQYQWEKVRQQLLGEKLAKASQKPQMPKLESRLAISGRNLGSTPTTSVARVASTSTTPRLLPHYGERPTAKPKPSADDPTTLAVPQEQGTPSHHLQHVLMSQPSFGSMKSMKPSLTTDSFEDSEFQQHFIPDFSSTNRPYPRPPPETITAGTGKKKAVAPRIIRSESKNIGKRLLQTTYTAPGILKTTVGKTQNSSTSTASTVKPPTTVTTTKPQPSQVLRLQLPPSFAGNASVLQQKRMVLVPVKDEKGGSRYILKVLPTVSTTAATTVTASNSIASTSGSHVLQNRVQTDHGNSVPLISTPPPLGHISQTFQKVLSPHPLPTKTPVMTSVMTEQPPLTLIHVPQPTAVVPSTQQQIELMNRSITSEIVLPTQQQVVISQPMMVPCTMQLQAPGILGPQQMVCTSDLNGLLQIGKQLVITQPSSVATTTCNNIVLLTSNNQVISSTINMTGS